MFVAIGSSFKFVCSAIILSKRKTRQRKEVSFVSRNYDEFKTPLRTIYIYILKIYSKQKENNWKNAVEDKFGR